MQLDQVQFGAVALVLAEAILGEPLTELSHYHITRDLCNHTRSRDAETETIAIDDGGLRKREWRDRQSIDQNVIGSQTDSLNRNPHRFMRSAQNVNRVDLDRIDDSDRPGLGRAPN